MQFISIVFATWWLQLEGSEISNKQSSVRSHCNYNFKSKSFSQKWCSNLLLLSFVICFTFYGNFSAKCFSQQTQLTCQAELYTNDPQRPPPDPRKNSSLGQFSVICWPQWVPKSSFPLLTSTISLSRGCYLNCSM